MRSLFLLPGALLPLALATPDFSDWRKPGTNDYRAPCPALNSLANHGILPRDGRNLSVPMLVSAMSEVFNLSTEVGTLVSIRAIDTSSTPGTGTFSLKDLQKHNMIEHDASLSRADDALSGDSHSFNQQVFDSWFRFFDGMDALTLPALAMARYSRVVTERYRNPAFVYGAIQQFSGYAESILILNGMVDEKGVCRKDYTRILFEEERLPYNEGWRPPKKSLNAFVFSLNMLQMALATPEKTYDAAAAELANLHLGTGSHAGAFDSAFHHQVPIHQGF
ncbi:Cloroperoxidase [Pseudovirgaria hyperparasitica]|uniref:Cloroperoxidase n=1 Tax=Pseudovirgaria hyperparasitica TaxID=470096 RepID=A0A6A6WMF0_9PEZI|nr:Cloroperoxidase [Pseudovirgaria hyperparasitica]KAF2763333.1 Cloroperoxidase [Pseudovirgaria hyperparasitica]